MVAGARLRLWAPAFFTRRFLYTMGLTLGLLVQMVLLWLVGEMVDLCITLMEVWAELARKHLEITLS